MEIEYMRERIQSEALYLTNLREGVANGRLQDAEAMDQRALDSKEKA